MTNCTQYGGHQAEEKCLVAGWGCSALGLRAPGSLGSLAHGITGSQTSKWPAAGDAAADAVCYRCMKYYYWYPSLPSQTTGVLCSTGSTG